MVTVLDRAEQQIKESAERLEKLSTAENAAALEQTLPDLAKKIKSGTATLKDIDSFLDNFPQIQAEIKGYLLSKKAYLLFQDGNQEEGLQNYDYALATFERPSTWALKGSALLQVERIDEALMAFQRAYELREYFGPQKQEYLKDLFWAWGTTAFFLGLDAILAQDSTELRKWVHKFLDIDEKAKSLGLEGIPGKVVFREPATQEAPGVVSEGAERTLIVYAHESELKDAVEELELAIKLLSIKDPFEGWRALGKEISKRWPKGVSVVEAVREMRQ